MVLIYRGEIKESTKVNHFIQKIQRIRKAKI